MKNIILTTLFICILNLLNAQTIDPGNTPGQLDVNLTGGASYSIPISVPPGIKDVVPQIGLAYNSQAGAGQAGWGWNITGLSAISRIPETTFHDGEIDGVDFDNKDRYALDGQRLILESGTYGTAGSVYITENYSNIKVKAFGTHPSGVNYGPLYFEVYYPNGNIATYGNWNNATSKLNWSISRWTDPQFNTINYFYSSGTEPRLISNIQYGSGNFNSNGINSIYFIWESRSKIENLFVGGENLQMTQRLKNIQVKNGTTVLRQYNLLYDSTFTTYDRLLNIQEVIQEVNGGVRSLNPISFDYLNSDTSIQQSTNTKRLGDFSANSFDQLRIVSGDFNSDGHVDLGVYKKETNKIYLYTTGDYSGNGLEINTIPINEHKIFTTNLLENNKLSNKQYISIAKEEQNGDIFDLKLYNYKIEGSTYSNFSVNSFNLPTYTSDECDGLENITHSLPLEFHEGDFNGDGISDLLAMEQYHEVADNCYFEWIDDPNISNVPYYDCICESRNTVNEKKVYLINLKDNTISFVGNTLFPISTIDNDIQPYQLINTGDFNGDGKIDILHVMNGKMMVYGLNENNQLVLLHQISHSDIYKKITLNNTLEKNMPVVFGDYNGDGLIDFMCPKFPQGSDLNTLRHFKDWRVYYSNGVRFFEKSYIGNLTNGISFSIHFTNEDDGLYKQDIIATDMDGDGKSEIINHLTEKSYTGNNDFEKLTVFKNNSNSLDLNFVSIYNYQSDDSAISAEGFPIFINSNHFNYSSEYAYIGKHPINNDPDKINVKRYFSTTNI